MLNRRRAQRRLWLEIRRVATADLALMAQEIRELEDEAELAAPDPCYRAVGAPCFFDPAHGPSLRAAAFAPAGGRMESVPARRPAETRALGRALLHAQGTVRPEVQVTEEA